MPAPSQWGASDAMVSVVREQLPRGLRDKYSIVVHMGGSINEALAVFRLPDGRYWACDLLPCPELGVVPLRVPDPFLANLCMEV